MIKQKSILVVGGAGYIGSATTRALCEQGFSVTVFDNLTTGKKEKVDSRAKLIKGDILNKKNLRDVFEKNNFDAVIHFAGLKAVAESEEIPADYFENNVTGLINVLSMMQDNKVAQIIFSSSASVYAANSKNKGIFIETDLLEPISVYGQTKYISELIIRDFARTNKIESYALLRYFNVAGDAGLNFKEKNPQNVFPLIARAIAGQAEFNIFGNDYDTFDGTGVRDYIHLTDLVSAHISALKVRKNNSGAFNLGTSNGYSVKELVDTFEKISNKSVGAKIKERRAGDPAIVLANSSKAKKEFGWIAQKTLDDMVTSTIKVYGNSKV